MTLPNPHHDPTRPPITEKHTSPDEELINKLRENFSHQAVAEELMKIVTELCGAIGVQIESRIVNIDKKHKVDVQTVINGIPRLSAAVAAVYAGSQINPLALIRNTENVTKLQRPEGREKPPTVDKG